MFITQRYTLRHAILYLGEFTGQENFYKSGKSEYETVVQGKELNTGFSTEVQ